MHICNICITIETEELFLKDYQKKACVYVYGKAQN